MSTELLTAEPDAELAGAVERCIRSRTWGQVRRLAVEPGVGRVTVRGLAPSYYVKQLAIQAVMEALGPRSAAVEVAIEVG